MRGMARADANVNVNLDSAQFIILYPEDFLFLTSFVEENNQYIF